MAVSDYSMFDVQAANEQQRHKTGYEVSQIPVGRVPIYASSVGGDIYNEGLMGLAGMMGGAPDPETAKQQAIAEIQARFPDPDTFEEFMELSNALRMGGFYEFAELALDAANDLRSSLPDETEDSQTAAETSMEMAEKFHQCAIDAGGWKNADQECKEAVKKTFLEMKRESAEEKGFGKFAIQNAEQVAANQTQIYTDSDAARDSLTSIEQSIGLLPTIYSGTAGGGIKRFKTLLVSLGIIDATRNVEEEMFLRNSMKSVTDWIAKTKGSISDKEMDAFVAASPGLQNTQAGNLLILQTMKAAAEYYTRLETEYNDWIRKAERTAQSTGVPVKMSDWRRHLETWYRANKVKLPTQVQIDAALNPDEVEEESEFIVTVG